MNFNEVAQKSAEICFKRLGSTAIYTPDDTGIPVDCTVIVDRDRTVFTDGFESHVSGEIIVIASLISEIGEPKKRDTFTADGTTWRVEGRSPDTPDDGIETRVIVK
ncbi:head-tail joining protein [Candidatus Vondammii sp. HM_W22]|uniref:head-tail joining protein n=1 Tax=Candidatus Vondammii sp. HM_W22 TaxID=2687299 RepID=UPI002E7C2DB5|nr:hypothetical protein [Candidatus Vondammii sp. HM_W22]